ncbi:MAG: glycosyltransferase family 1 protein [Patescibacteria group bacterium]
MIIGFDARVLMDKHYSGVSEYAANLLAALFELDPDNEYRLFYNSWRDLSGRLDFLKRPGVKIIASRYPNKIFNYLGQKLLAYPKIDQLIGGCDLFFAPHLNFCALSPQTKFVLTVHDLSFLRYPEFFSGRKNIWHRALAVKRLIERADRVVAVSENTRQDLIELLGLGADKISVVHSGLNRRASELRSEAITEFLKIHKLSSPYILYLGNVEPRKNILGLIRAYELFRANNPDRSELLVIAGADAWKTKEIRAAWQGSSYKNDIRLLGYVSETDKACLYLRAGLFVYPSFYEGFGFPPLEALSYNLPVVCSNVSSLPEVGGKAVLSIDPYNIPQLAKALGLGLSDTTLRDALIGQAKQQVAEFSWSGSARAYLDLFKSLS